MKTIKQLEEIFNPLLFKTALTITAISICFLAFSHNEQTINDYDKANHIFAFIVLTFLLDFAYPKSDFMRTKLIALLGYGMFIEVVQYFLPYRTFSLIDIAADGLGVLLYIVLKRRIIAVRSLA